MTNQSIQSLISELRIESNLLNLSENNIDASDRLTIIENLTENIVVQCKKVVEKKLEALKKV